MVMSAWKGSGVEQEDETDNLEECAQHGSHMAFGSHLQEDAEDVEGQAGDDNRGDDTGDDVAEVDKEPFHGGAADGGSGKSQDKCKNQGGGDRDECRHFDGEIGSKRIAHVHATERSEAVAENVGIGKCAGAVGKGTRKDGGAVGENHRDEQQLARTLAKVGNAGGYKADDK